jgi:hypothetical protein
MRQYWRHDDEESLEVGCPVCHVGPGVWCVYVRKAYRAGRETVRLHVERRHKLWRQRPVFAPRRHYLVPALASLYAFDRAEDAQLRAWLHQHVHLLLDLGQQ